MKINCKRLSFEIAASELKLRCYPSIFHRSYLTFDLSTSHIRHNLNRSSHKLVFINEVHLSSKLLSTIKMSIDVKQLIKVAKQALSNKHFKIVIEKCEVIEMMELLVRTLCLKN